MLAAEQSNSLLTIGDVAMLKMYRRISAGPHPETEMNHYLTSQGFAHAPALLGDVVHVASDGAQATLAIALQFVRNEGDAWAWMLDHLTRAVDAEAPAEPVAGSRADLLADSMPLPGQSADGLAKCMPFWRARRRIPRSPPKLLMTAMPPDGQRKRTNAFKRRSRPSLVCRRGSVNRIRNVHRSL